MPPPPSTSTMQSYAYMHYMYAERLPPLTCNRKQPGASGGNCVRALSFFQLNIHWQRPRCCYCCYSNRHTLLMRRTRRLIYQSKVTPAPGRALIGYLWQDGRSDWLKCEQSMNSSTDEINEIAVFLKTYRVFKSTQLHRASTHTHTHTSSALL